jgi:CRP/FNR family transcriptional regulator
MNEIEPGCVVCDRKAECFKYLTNKELKMFSEGKSTVHYKKGETIIKQGTEFTHVVSFNAGLAKLNVEVSRNKNVMIGILKPSEILGGPGMFQNNRYSFSITALTDSSICLISVELFKKMIAVNEKFAESFLASFSSRYTEVINRLVSMSHKHMNGRVAEALLYLSEDIYNSDIFEIPLTRQELADYTGTSKESISRIFKSFHLDKLIEVNGRLIKMINSDKLRDVMLKG